MRIRPYRASDLDTLYQIDQSCFPSGIAYERWQLESFVADRESATWVAEVGGKTVGFLVACRKAKRGYIITIDVVEAWRRGGVGSALMDAAEQWAEAEGLTLISLETALDNAVAQSFYERRGYEKLRVVEKYYANGTDAWVMFKWLKKNPGRRKPEARRGA